MNYQYYEYDEQLISEKIKQFCLNKVKFTDFYQFDSLVDDKINLKCFKTVSANPTINYVPAYHFHICLGDDVIGQINIRIGFTFGLYFGGHIGYEIKEEYRGNNYATRAVKLVISVAKKHQMKLIYITNKDDNYPSIRVCQKVGAKYLGTVSLPPDNEMRQNGNVANNIWQLNI